MAAVGKPSTQRKSPARETGLVSVIGSTWSLGATTLHRQLATPTGAAAAKEGGKPRLRSITHHRLAGDRLANAREAETCWAKPLPGRHAISNYRCCAPQCGLSPLGLCRKLSVDDIDDVNSGEPQFRFCRGGIFVLDYAVVPRPPLPRNRSALTQRRVRSPGWR